MTGVVYLLHLDRPFGPGGGANGRGTAKHWAADLDARLAEHEVGGGVPLLPGVRGQASCEAGGKP
jgi:hypothetical protein